MSDPVTNFEIEDVLSSIKRLVSTDKVRETPAKARENAVDDLSTKLVLTPALRVTEPVEAEEPFESEDDETVDFAAPVDEPASDFDQSHQTAARDSLEATIAELEAAVIAQPDEWEPDGSEVTSIPTWETASYPALDDVEDAVAVEETSPEDMRDDAAWDEPILTSGPFIPEDAPVSFRDNIESLDTAALTFAHVQPIPAADDEEDYGDELLPDADAVGTDDDLDTYLSSDPATFDEEAMRQLVMEIVREELQGKLGERITRNVRKMVRREIHRALDLNGLD